MTTSTISLVKTPQRGSALQALDGMFRKVLQRLVAKKKEAVPRGGGEDIWRRFRDASPAERYRTLLQDPSLAGRRLCSRLLDEAEGRLGSDSWEAENLAQLALFIAHRLEPGKIPPVVVFDYQARAWLLSAEARTTSGALEGSSMALQMAGCLLSCGSGDVELQASFLRAKARLYRSRGEEELARRAEYRARVITGVLELDRVCF